MENATTCLAGHADVADRRNHQYPGQEFPQLLDSGEPQAMPSQATRMSVVLPVRDSAEHITVRVEQVLNALADLSRAATEVVVVDDGSKDATPEILDELRNPVPASSCDSTQPATGT